MQDAGYCGVRVLGIGQQGGGRSLYKDKARSLSDRPWATMGDIHQYPVIRLDGDGDGDRSRQAKVSTILSIADIHIRCGDLERSRYDEYQQVLNRLCSTFADMECVKAGEAVIAVLGDLFHSKGRMDTTTVKMWFRWMDQLLELAPVMVILGNHDYRQEDPNYPDMISVMTAPYRKGDRAWHKYPLLYLEDTGYYVYKNIGIGMMSVKDTLREHNTRGRVKELPRFPPADVLSQMEGVDHIVAFFHGSVSRSVFQNGQRVEGLADMYPIEWFAEAGYPCVLLGDIHKQQINNCMVGGNNIVWGYPGSLVQQDFGENTFGHGFLAWALKEGNITCGHIANDFGMVTVKRKGDGSWWVIIGSRKMVKLGEAVKMADFPKTPRVRVLGKLQDQDAVKEAFAHYGIQPVSILMCLPLSNDEAAGGGIDLQGLLMDGAGSEGEGDGEGDGDGDDEGSETNRSRRPKEIQQLAQLNSPDKWLEYLCHVAPELAQVSDWIRKPETMAISLSGEEAAVLSADTVSKIRERNGTIARLCEEYREATGKTHSGQYRITLKHMAWDYAMCYGADNYFDFTDLSKKITLLNGRNATGKSSFLDVLCIGLFGEPTKSRHVCSGRSMSAKIIHDQRPSNTTAMNVRVMFEMDGDGIYEVVRTFGHQVKEDRGAYLARSLQSAIYKLDLGAASIEDCRSKKLVCEGTTAVDAWIGRYIGTLDDILMSTIVSQMDNTNFFFMKSEDQKALLDRALHLESIGAYAKIAHEAILTHAAIIQKITTTIETLRDGTTISAGGGKSVDAIQKEIDDWEGRRTDHEAKKEELVGRLANLVGDGIQVPEAGSIKAPRKRKERLLEKLKTDAFAEGCSDADRQAALLVKGEVKARWDDIHEGLAALGYTGGAAEQVGAGAGDELKQWNAVLDELRESKPILKWSDKELARNKAAVEDWKLQKEADGWADPLACDPEELEASVEQLDVHFQNLDKKYRRLLESAVPKPDEAEPDASAMKKKLEPGAEGSLTAQDLADVREKVSEIEGKWRDAVKEQAGFRPCRRREDEAAWLRELGAWEERVSSVDGHTVADIEEHIAWCKSSLEAFEAKERERLAIMDDIQRMEELEAEAANVPFNPDCFACRQQPVRIMIEKGREKRAEYAKTLQRIKRYISKCGVADGEENDYVSKMKQDMADHEMMLGRARYYEETVDRMTREKAAWEQARDEWVRESALADDVRRLESSLGGWKQLEVKMEWILWRNWSKKDAKIRQAMDETRAERDKMSEFLAEYEGISRLVNDIAGEDNARQALEAWTERWSEAETEAERLEQALKCGDLLKAKAELEATMTMNGAVFERIMEYEKIQTELRGVEAYMTTEELQKVRDTLDKYDSHLEDLREQMGKMKQEAADREAKEARMKILRDIQAVLVKRREQMVLLEEKFMGDKTQSDGYKEWVYRHKVIPLLEKEVNQFLATTDPIRLKIDYRGKKLIYTVLDRGNEPTLDHASGYQKYMINLAMRAGLARISAVGQNISAMFIDEGFVACDSVNIEKTHMIMANIMEYSGYDVMVIMSHLDTIRDAADVQVDIRNAGAFSYIQHGMPYPTVMVAKEPTVVAGAAGAAAASEGGEAAPQKRRGRPKKVIAA